MPLETPQLLKQDTTAQKPSKPKSSKRVRALRAKILIFLNIWPLAGPNIGFIGIWKAVSCLKPTGREGCVGLRRENLGFQESKKLKP